MGEGGPRAGRRRTSTIYDIARATDASPSTVSLVLSGAWSRYRIKEDTANRIQQSAKSLGYKVNLKARGLRTSRSGLAGMVLPHYRMRFFADLAEAFEAEARRRNLCPIVVSTQRDPEVEEQVTENMLAQKVEFLFIAGVPDPARLNELCKAAAVPCVNLDLPSGSAPSVVCDNEGGARRLTETLVSQVLARGRSPADILLVGGVEGEYASDRRLEGFLAATRAAGIEPSKEQLHRCGYSPDAARQALEGYQARRGRLPAGVLANSITAFEGLIQFAGRQPRGALDYLAVGCFDWDPFAAHLPYSVTMLRQDVEAMVAKAFEALSPGRQAGSDLIVVPPMWVDA